MNMKLSSLMLGVLTCSLSIHAQVTNWTLSTNNLYPTQASGGGNRTVSIGTTSIGAGLRLQVANKTQMDSLYVQHANALFMVRDLQTNYNYTSITPAQFVMNSTLNIVKSVIRPGYAMFGQSSGFTEINYSRLTVGNITEQTRMDANKMIVKSATSPDSTEILNNCIKTKAVYVGTSGWTITAPDYVFHKDYKLKPLPEVKQFIEKNGHLPGVPSASAMEKKGSVNLVEMNMTLLKKVEELTLHLIEQDRKINEQGDEIERLKTARTKTE
jgi:hypothetical protein